MKHTYRLTGKSIKQMRKAGEPFWSQWHNGEKFEDEKGFKGKVTFDSDNLFLKDSNNKTLKEQLAMVKKIKGAFIGNAATYCELAFAHFKKTGERLFGENYDYNYTRTITKTDESRITDVGYFRAAGGLSVDSWKPGEGHASLFVAPLVAVGSGNLDVESLEVEAEELANPEGIKSYTLRDLKIRYFDFRKRYQSNDSALEFLNWLEEK